VAPRKISPSAGSPGTARPNEPVTTELLRLCLLGGFLLAPMPLVLSILADDAHDAGPPPWHMALSALVLWVIAESLMVTAAQTLVLVDLETRRPTAIPEELRRILREFEGIDLVE